MAPEKVTEMILNVDLKCSGCYKKVKKVICKIPQIRDQMFDVEKNKVKIIVVCCSPEKIRDKLCYKGGGAIQSIEIIEKPPGPPGDKPKPPADKPKPPADKPKPPGDKPPADKPKPPADKPADKPKPPADKPKPPGDKPPPEKKPDQKPADKPKPPADKPKDGDKPKEAPKKADAGPGPDVAKMVYEPVHGYPQMYPPSAYPMVGYGQYYDQGYGGAPFQHGYGMPIAAPPPPPPSYGGFGYDNGYNGYNGYNGNRNHYGGEEDGEGCSIM
ncbi:putative heavy metal-associated domain superfamily [Helianthus debilis subsp. tardiflorus]